MAGSRQGDPQGGPLWGLAPGQVQAVVGGFEGAMVKLRFSLDGTLNKQATVEGILRYPSVPDPRYVEITGERVSDRRTAVLFSRMIDIRAVPSPPRGSLGVYHGQPPKRPADVTTCPTRTCHPGRPDWLLHCGECSCCPREMPRLNPNDGRR